MEETEHEITAEVDRVRRRRSTVGRSVGGRLSLAAPPSLSVKDQVLRIDTNLPWEAKLSMLLDVCLREAVRRLEARLPGDECVPELRACVLTQTKDVTEHAAQRVCVPPVHTTTHQSAGDCATPAPRVNPQSYKKKTQELKEEYMKWKKLRKERESECHAAEVELREAKSGVTVLDEEVARHLSTAQHSPKDTILDYHCYTEETRLAREKAQLILEEIRHTTETVANLLTASKLQAETSYSALENMSIGHQKIQPLTAVLNSILQQHSTSPPRKEEAHHMARPEAAQ